MVSYMDPCSVVEASLSKSFNKAVLEEGVASVVECDVEAKCVSEVGRVVLSVWTVRWKWKLVVLRSLVELVCRCRWSSSQN